MQSTWTTVTLVFGWLLTIGGCRGRRVGSFEYILLGLLILFSVLEFSFFFYNFRVHLIWSVFFFSFLGFRFHNFWVHLIWSVDFFYFFRCQIFIIFRYILFVLLIFFQYFRIQISIIFGFGSIFQCFLVFQESYFYYFWVHIFGLLIFSVF